MRLLFFILLSSTCFSQNQTKGFYLGFSPNSTFSKVTQNDALKGLKAGTGIGIGVQVGYLYPISNNFSMASELNLVFNSYKSTYTPFDFRTKYIKLFPQAKIKIYYNIPLNKKTVFATNVGVSVDLIVPYDSQRYEAKDSVSSITVTQNTKPLNNLYTSLGLGLLNIRKKRDWYIGVSFSKGWFTNYSQKNTYITNNTNYVSVIEGTNTHFSLDFIFYLKKKKLIE